MSYFVAKAERADRADIIFKAQALISGPDVTDDDLAEFDRMMASADKKMSYIERLETARNRSAELNEIIGAAAERSHISTSEYANDMDKFKKGFVAALRHAAHLPLSPRDKVHLDDYHAAASVGTGSTGGFTVATELQRTIYAALALEGGVRAAATIMTTDQGNNILLPAVDDTANIAVLVAENASLGTAADQTFSQITLSAYKYTSGTALVSKELLQDSAFSFDEFVQSQLVHRFTRGTNLAYTTGTGSAQPQGIVTAAASGKVGATGQTTSVLYADLVDLEHSVAVPYRRNAGWMMSDGAFKSIKKLVDTVGRPLWIPSLDVNAPDSLLSYNIIINADMAAPAANAKSILFGDLKQFIVRDVLDLNFQVLVELFAASGQIGIVGIMRTDSRLASVGNCLRYYQNSAT